MRVFLGVDGLGRYGELLVQGLKENNIEVDLCDSRPTRDRTKLKPKFTILQLRNTIESKIVRDGDTCFLSPSKKFLEFANSYDCFIFYFADSLYPGMLDIPILSSLGKRIVFCSAGEDTICPYIEMNRGEWRGVEHLKLLMNSMPEEPKTQAEMVSKWYSHHNTLTRKLYMIRMVEKYGTCILPSGATGLAKKPFYRALPICDPALLARGRIKADKKIEYPIRLSHYTSNATTKSSNKVQDIFEESSMRRLESSGLLISKIYPRLPQDQLFDSLDLDHIVVDQLAGYGTLTRQAAALCTVPITGPNAESHIYKNGFQSIPSIEIWTEDQLGAQIKYLTLNLDALKNYRDMVFNVALSLSPARQAQKLLHIIDKSEMPQAVNSWGNIHLVPSLKRLSALSNLIKEIDNYMVYERIESYL